MKPQMFYVEISVERPSVSGNWVTVRKGIFNPEERPNPLRLSENGPGDEDIPEEALNEFQKANPGMAEAGEHQVRVGDATYRMIFLHEG